MASHDARIRIGRLLGGFGSVGGYEQEGVVW